MSTLTFFVEKAQILAYTGIGMKANYVCHCVIVIMILYNWGKTQI